MQIKTKYMKQITTWGGDKLRVRLDLKQEYNYNISLFFLLIRNCERGLQLRDLGETIVEKFLWVKHSMQ